MICTYVAVFSKKAKMSGRIESKTSIASPTEFCDRLDSLYATIWIVAQSDLCSNVNINNIKRRLNDGRQKMRFGFGSIALEENGFVGKIHFSER